VKIGITSKFEKWINIELYMGNRRAKIQLKRQAMSMLFQNKCEFDVIPK
jgi:hypothetical protein